jgi:hypothetical protein
MNKATKYAINGAFWAGVLNAILNAINQANEIEQNPGQEFDWKRLLVAAGKGAAVGGLGGFAIGSIADYQNRQIKPINTDFALLSLTNKVRLDKADPMFVKLNERAVQLSNMLSKEYGNLIHSMPRLGSTENGTALKEKFDIDFGVNFRPNSFRSTEEMFFSLLTFFQQQTGKASITRIRDQRKSIGVFVLVEGTEHKIDVVPCKLTRGGRGAGYLYVNDNSLFGKPSYTKTNIRVLKNIKLTPTQQKIAIALKKWKMKYGLPISSYLLQNLILDAYAYAQSIPRGLTAKVIMVLKHIATSMDVAVIRGEENTNNVITNIPLSDKEAIIAAARNTVDEYSYQPNYIVSILN